MTQRRKRGKVWAVSSSAIITFRLCWIIIFWDSTSREASASSLRCNCRKKPWDLHLSIIHAPASEPCFFFYRAGNMSSRLRKHPQTNVTEAWAHHTQLLFINSLWVSRIRDKKSPCCESGLLETALQMSYFPFLPLFPSSSVSAVREKTNERAHSTTDECKWRAIKA